MLGVKTIWVYWCIVSGEQYACIQFFQMSSSHRKLLFKHRKLLFKSWVYSKHCRGSHLQPRIWWWQFYWVPSTNNSWSKRSASWCTLLQNWEHATSSSIMLPWQISRKIGWGCIFRNQNNVFKDEVQELQLRNENILLLQLVQAHVCAVPWQASCRNCTPKCKQCFNELNVGYFGIWGVICRGYTQSIFLNKTTSTKVVK